MKTYSLFRKIGPRKYQRLSPIAYTLQFARRAFQSALLAGSMQGYAMYLRPAASLTENDADWNMVNNARKVFLEVCSLQHILSL